MLFRVENGRVDRIRSLSRGCGIDVGGLPFHWITGVRPAESLELLESLVGTGVSTSKKKDKGGDGRARDRRHRDARGPGGGRRRSTGWWRRGSRSACGSRRRSGWATPAAGAGTRR